MAQPTSTSMLRRARRTFGVLVILVAFVLSATGEQATAVLANTTLSNAVSPNKTATNSVSSNDGSGYQAVLEFGAAGVMAASGSTVISSPAGKAPVKVGYRQVVAGRTKGMARTRHLWVVVQPVSNHLNYPQTGPVALDAHGRWTVVTYFGLPGRLKKPEGFRLLVVSANNAANKKLKAYMSRSKKAGRYLGLDTLPTGAILVKSMSVVRKH